MDEKLGQLAAEWKARSFDWGVSDCCQFGRSAAWILHGIVLETEAYISERQALRVFRKHGEWPGLFAMAGMVQRDVNNARRGDFVTFTTDAPSPFGAGLGVVFDVYARAQSALGLVVVPRSAWLNCWGPPCHKP